MLVVPSPKSHSADVISPSDAFVNSTVNGASPDSTSIENEDDGGTGVGAGISVDAGVAVGGKGVAGIAVAASGPGESEGIMKSHAGRIAKVNMKYVRNMNGLFFNFGAPGIASSN